MNSLIRSLLRTFFSNFLPLPASCVLRRGKDFQTFVLVLILGALISKPVEAFGEDYGSDKVGRRYYMADINVTYVDPTGAIHHDSEGESGKYGDGARISPESGTLVHVQHHTPTGISRNGCKVHDGPVPSTRWIALVKRGGCTFKEKIKNAAHAGNASAVLIYNNESATGILQMNDEVSDVISVSISYKFGEHLARLANNGTKVSVAISVGRAHTTGYNNISKTSVLFVSISFIVLMIISLAWLVFYYIQRFRYAHAKERLSRRLANAAKKALTKIPQRTVKSGDKETATDFDQCAICIEGYKTHDVIRILPCKHIFHKSCVDPWLLEQRSCPMCKMDILKAYGFLSPSLHMSGSQDSVTNPDSSGQPEALELVVDLASARADVRASPRSRDSSSEHTLDQDSGDSLTLHHVQVLHLQPPDVETHDRERSTRRLNNLGVSAIVVDDGVDAIEAEDTERQSLMSAHTPLNEDIKNSNPV